MPQTKTKTADSPYAAQRNSSYTDLEASEIRRALGQILSSKTFSASESLGKFLSFVVEETLGGRAKNIKQFTVATAVYNMGSDFDPQTDPIVRLQAGRLRRALDSYYANEDAEYRLRIHIPKGSYVPKFEFKSTSRPELAKQQVSAHGLPLIAILPFTNYHENDEYVAIGLSEELSIELSQLPNVRVLSFYSSYQIQGSRKDPIELGRQLKVDFVLDGSVRREMETINVKLTLFRIDTGEQIWARRFQISDSIEELKALQAELVSTVAMQVGDDFGYVNQSLMADVLAKDLTDIRAFEAVLREHHFQLTQNPLDFIPTHNALLKAVEVSPTFAPAWAYLSQSYIDSYVFEFADLEDPLTQGAYCARKALSLDRNCQYAHHARAFLKLVEKDKEGITQSAEEIIRINPRAAYMVGVAGFWIAVAGDYDRGVNIIESSARLNPFYPGWFLFAHYLQALNRRDYQAALDAANDLGLPDFFWSPLLRAAALGLQDRRSEANTAYQELISMKPDFPAKCETYISFFVLSQDIVDLMLKGLRVASQTDD